MSVHKPSRSVRLKKYGIVYKEYIRNRSKSPIKSRHVVKNDVEEKKVEKVKAERKKTALNTYQKFVKEESTRDKYKTMKGSERMLAISQAWEKKKRKEKRKNNK
jgi:hypothetical protein